MRNDIRLYIGGQEVEFSKDPNILFNYKQDELRNPTIVRNMFSKQITLESTNKNNTAFGHIWDLTRIQEGMAFNPIKKTDFQLFINDELYQKGYAKLDKITRTNNTTQYAITLYGQLGSFLYNLTYDDGGTGSTVSSKKTLASLKYITAYDPEPKMEFTINKDTVYEAWGHLASFWTGTTDQKWKVINFIPALNGIPTDFDASKVLINNNGLNTGGRSGFYNGTTVEGVTYQPVLNGLTNQNGYSLGEMPEDLQEWQTRDLRSYNQRPIISMWSIIQACCQPENNGGYEVILDNHFFHANNPYYNDAWLTLPMLKDLEGVEGGETHTITNASVVRQGTTNYYDIDFQTSLAEINNVNLNLQVRFTPDSQTNATNLYGDRTFNSRGVVTLTGHKWVKTYKSNTGVVLQMLAYGSNGEIVAQSKAYFLGGEKDHAGYNIPMWDQFWKTGDLGVEPEYVWLDGYWKKVDGNFVFVDRSGRPTNINFSFPANNSFTNLILKVYQPNGYSVNYFFNGSTRTMDPNGGIVRLYQNRTKNTSGQYSLGDAMTDEGVTGSWSFVVESMEAVVTDYEGMFSGTKITKEKLLTTEFTPADYLLSYCKMFGLYFYFDSAEESSDPNRYPAGVIHIMDRDTFYTEEVVDLSPYIDWDKKIEITPALADTKWYKFDTEHVEGELETGYMRQYGQEYGSQLINTNFNFNAETTDLYDGNAYKAGIMALEKDKYYKKTTLGLPVYQYNGLKYQLFHRNTENNEFDSTEVEFPVSTTSNMTSVNPDYEFYDMFPKLQFHGEENQAEDGANVLVFLKGRIGSPNVNYWLTDDVSEMVTLNDGTPCWLLTRTETDGAGTTIAKKVNYFPYFTRDLILFGTYGNIVHSWNFGHPQVIYIPDTYSTQGDSIYDKCWKDYMHDLFDVDTRKLTCYVNAQLDGRPWPYWLRRYYWFENSLWRLNEIKDMNPASFETTKMEFIKVQDMDNYKLEKITYNGHNELILDQADVACTGGTVTGRMLLQSAGGWYAGDYIYGTDEMGHNYALESATYMNPNRGSGDFETPFTITVPASQADYPITWTVAVEDDFDNWYRGQFVQDTCNTGSTLSITPMSTSVSSAAGSYEFSLAAVRITGLTITCDKDWVTLSVVDNTITATYTRNANTSVRAATITATGTGVDGPMDAVAVLLQDAASYALSITSTQQIPATATAITYTVVSDEAVTVTLDSSAIPQPISNSHAAGTHTGSFTIPVNQHSYVEYWGLYAQLTNYPSVTAYTSVEQMGTSSPIYTNIPLTFHITTAGTINWKHNRTLTSDIGNLTIQYRINGGTWTNLTASTAGTSFNVSVGDEVEFRGDNSRYSSLPLSYTTFSGSTAGFEAYGNIMSLISSTGYETATTLSQQYCFNRMFASTKLVSAENLAMPATVLPMHVYTSMFQGCTLMTTAPVLPAHTLTNSCYNEMFEGCTSLNYIKCLATDVTAYNCTYNWVQNVAPTGTFVKEYGMTGWSIGDNGIPTNWVVQDNLGTLTGISLQNVTWVTDVPAGGGVATYQNCSYQVIAYYDNGAQADITSQAIMTASTTLNVPASLEQTRHSVGTISVIADYYDGPNPFSTTQVMTVYQEAYVSPVSEKYIVLHLEYTGATNPNGLTITAKVPNATAATTAQTWTPSYAGDAIELVFSAGQVTSTTLSVDAVDQVPPYLTTITGVLMYGSQSDTESSSGQLGIHLEVPVDFGYSHTVTAGAQITGVENY